MSKWNFCRVKMDKNKNTKWHCNSSKISQTFKTILNFNLSEKTVLLTKIPKNHERKNMIISFNCDSKIFKKILDKILIIKNFK